MQRIISLLAVAALPLIAGTEAVAQERPKKDPPPLPEIDSYTLRTGIAQQPVIELLLRLPLAKETIPDPALDALPSPFTLGRENSPVRGVVVYSSWEDDPAALRKLLEKGTHPLVRWANDQNMAVLTFDTATHWKSRRSTEQLSAKQRSTLDHQFDRIAAVWDRGARVICRRHGLPEDGFFAYGISRGSHYIHRLVVRHPDRFQAVHLHVPNTFDVSGKHSDKICWLITTGLNDPGRDAAERYSREKRGEDWPILFCSFFGMGHESDSRVDALRREFFDHLLAAPSVATDPSLLGAVREVTGMTERFRQAIEEPQWVADSMNGVVYPVTAMEKIPEPQRIFLPTRSLAAHWGRIFE